MTAASSSEAPGGSPAPSTPFGATNGASPVELEHAIRHLAMAQVEWNAGKQEMTAMHLREALCDTAWSLYMLPIAFAALPASPAVTHTGPQE